MKKARIGFAVVSLVFMLLLTSCSFSNAAADKADILNLFHDNRATIVSAVKDGNFDSVERIPGIHSVYQSNNYIDFSCGGAGLGSATDYRGFFYSKSDDLTAWNGGVCRADELETYGNGYQYRQPDGDNEYYVEQIEDHFFYYEAHF